MSSSALAIRTLSHGPTCLIGGVQPIERRDVKAAHSRFGARQRDGTCGHPRCLRGGSDHAARLVGIDDDESLLTVFYLVAQVAAQWSVGHEMIDA